MVRENSLGNRPGELYPPQNIVTYLAVVLDNAELILINFSGLAEDFRRHGYLADIMEQPGNVNAHHLPLGKAHLPGDSPCQLRHPALMAGGIRVPGLHYQRYS